MEDKRYYHPRRHVVVPHADGRIEIFGSPVARRRHGVRPGARVERCEDNTCAVRVPLRVPA
jgi:hypothetical protein